MNLDTDENENVNEDPSSSTRNVNKFPSLSGFFPILPLKKITKLSYETAYHANHVSSPFTATSEKIHYLNPKASTLTPMDKDNMESVRRSLIESHSVLDVNSNIEAELEKVSNLDNSAIVIMNDRVLNSSKTKKITTFGKVNQLSIPSRKESEKEFECTNEKMKEFLEKLLNNNYSMAFITLLTIYCLFGDDVRTGFINKSYDLIFNVISIVCIAIFTLEIGISIVVKQNYYLSFFFWLDLISAVSILLDLVWIQNLIFMGGQSSNITRASRFSRFGAKAGRVIRLVRLFRIVKLYKTFSDKQRQRDLKEMIEIRKNSIFAQDIHITSSRGSIKEKKRSIDKKETPSISIEKHKSIFHTNNSSDKWYLSPTLKEVYKRQSQSVDSSQLHALTRASHFNHDPIIENFNNNNNLPEEEDENSDASESRVGQKLTDLTIKRVLVLVFLMIFLVPLFSSNYWFDPTLSYDIGLKIIKNYTETSRNMTAGFNESTDSDLTALCSLYISINTIGDKVTYPLISLLTPINNTACSYQSDAANSDILRDEEKDLVQLESYVATINKKAFVVNNSIISICRTLYICVVLGASALYFAKDAHDLVLRPIERMLNKVNNIAKNPLASKYQQLIENKTTKKNQEVMETTFIENAIVKISTLLALGLGDAGAEIITSNIAKMGDLVCISPGIKRFGIFGFCDIRNFTDATEILQEEVMIFVNNIAEIVHTIVDRFQGSANKNIGDAFLLVWKFRIEDQNYITEKMSRVFRDPNQINEIKLLKTQERSKDDSNAAYINDLCDLSLMSFLKILCKINRNEKILKYRLNPGLNTRLHCYKVKMGFGLHLGWAIEGSIGSEYKIDASYLSPNVNLASRLEAATKQYGIPLLLSHTLYEFLSDVMKKACRKIDVVAVKGSTCPLGLFTVDLDFEKLPSKEESQKSILERRQVNALKKMAVGLGLENKTFKFEELFMYDKDLMLAYTPLDQEFRNCFGEGVDKYLSGEWSEAEKWLKKALCCHENDGPSKTLLAFMERNQFEQPYNWCGYRELVEK